MKIAVIPARGGSKRILKKNIRDFHGRPIIAYSIEKALETGLFDRVIVSTDSHEIAEIARRWGAETPFIRPENISDDFTGTNPIVRHAIKWFNENDELVDYACCIYATSPFLRVEFLQEGWKTLVDRGQLFAFSVTSFPFPIQRAISIGNDGGIEPFMKIDIRKRSQDLDEFYHDAGQFYWGTAKAFLDEEPLYSTKSTGVILPRYLVQDIDTLEDWKCAELMYKALQESQEI
jgi:pseudaminic acid cytidylyltransferase